MFNKTRRKIVFIVVFSLLALMTVTLVTIFITNRIALQNENEEILETYVERFSLDDQPGAPGEAPLDIPDGVQQGEQQGETDGERPDGRGDRQNNGTKPGPRDGIPDKNEPEFQLSTFYSVAYSAEGEVLSINNGNNALQSEESLLSTTSSILKSGKTRGRTGNMTYIVETRDDYTLVAMIDGTINNSNQNLLFRQMLIIGSIALAILAVIAIFLARRIVRPLEESDKKQKQFVSDAGHELKTPIAVVSANSELLRRQIGGNEWLDNIDYENERMSELVKQLLVLSKAENSDIPKEPLDFSKLANGEVLPFESLAFEKGVMIDSRVEPDIMVHGNSGQLKQLISILLDNALEHGKGGTIRLSLKKEKRSALLSVSNEADEISPERAEHLFDRFYRADESRGDAGSHYGLGLSIAKAVAEGHGGRISAEFRDGIATFTATIPAK